MNWRRRIIQFLSSKTLAVGLLGFLLSLFATEILYAVPQGMELQVAGILFIPIFLLLVHYFGFPGEFWKRWLQWRRILSPSRVGVLGPYFDDTKEGGKCELQFVPNSGWIDYFRQANSENKRFEVTEIDWTEISSKYFVIVNPFGEIYLEGDKRKLSTYERIKDFVADGGIFVCTGGFPFYYYWDPIIERPVDTTPRTRTVQGGMIEDNRYFTDSLVTRDFGAIITNDPEKPNLVHSYQDKTDLEFFGDLQKIGGTDLIWEFRSLSKETRGVIPGLRVNHGTYVKFPLAAISYGEGYLIVSGMALKPAGIEFFKLAEGLINFSSTIAGKRKTIWQKKYEETKNKLKSLKNEEQIKAEKEEKPLTVIGRFALYFVLVLISLIGTWLFSMFRSSFLESHNAFWKLYLTPLLQFDFYGAILPILLGLSFAVISLAILGVPKLKYVSGFLLSYAFGIFFFQPLQGSEGSFAIVGVPLNFSFLVSAVTAMVVFLVRKKTTKEKGRISTGIAISKKRFARALLVAGSFGFLSVVLVDLTYFSVVGTMHVGALGITDGILLSGLYALLSMTFLTCFVMLCFQINKLIRIIRARKHLWEPHSKSLLTLMRRREKAAEE